MFYENWFCLVLRTEAKGRKLIAVFNYLVGEKPSEGSPCAVGSPSLETQKNLIAQGPEQPVPADHDLSTGLDVLTSRDSFQFTRYYKSIFPYEPFDIPRVPITLSINTAVFPTFPPAPSFSWD